MILRTQDGYQFEEQSLKAVSGKGLSPRELISLLYKASGLNTKEIAEEMHCAITTANKRQQNINYKLNAKNSIQAVSEAFRKGIIIHLLIIITSSFGAATSEHSDMARHRTQRTSRTQIRSRRDLCPLETDLLFLNQPSNEATA